MMKNIILNKQKLVQTLNNVFMQLETKRRRECSCIYNINLKFIIQKLTDHIWIRLI
jgi:hypothetical protein